MGRVFLGTHPAPNETGFNFNKRIWEFFLKLEAGLGIAPLITTQKVLFYSL